MEIVVIASLNTKITVIGRPEEGVGEGEGVSGPEEVGGGGWAGRAFVLCVLN